MRVITRATLRDFWTLHPDSKQPLTAWSRDAERALWTGPNDIKAQYSSASFLHNDRVVFNIGGNNYRLVTHVAYVKKLVFIRFLGTHAEYDKISAEEI